MRNLKRVLSLALALMMALGVMAFSGSASAAGSTSIEIASQKYNDYDAVAAEYLEAIDVTTALNIARGDETGALNPSENLTRAEATAILARMLMGANADNLNNVNAVTKFTDVAYDNWAASYINYCTNQGIISGMTDTTFNPTGDLTGAAFGKMLLVALGYNADTERYKGNGWETNVAIGLANAGIKIDGLDLNATLTREAAMEMTFQTLTADMVTYGGYVGTIGGQSIILGTGVATKVGNDPNNDYAGRSAVPNEDKVQQFCEAYFPKLLLNTNTHDDYGRPASTWQLDGDDITTHANDATKIYTSKVNANNLGLTGYSLDADFDGGTTKGEYVDGLMNNSTGITAVADIAGLTDNGVQVEVYTSGKTITDVVVINTYVAKIGSYTAAKGDNSAYITLASVSGDNTVTSKLNTKTFNTTVFNADDVDAVVLFTVAVGSDGKAYPATVEIAVSDEVVPTYLNATDDTFRVGGTSYNYSVNKVGAIVSSDVTNAVEKLIYFDKSGNVIFVTGATVSSTNYAVVLDTGNNGLSQSHIAQLLFTDGTIDIVNTLAAATRGDIVTYEVSKSNVYTLTSVDNKVSSENTPVEGIITQGRPTITGLLNKAANSKTIFLINTATSDEAHYVVYTGIANVPTIKAAPENVKFAYDGSVLKVVYVGTVSEITGAENANNQVLFVAKDNPKTITSTLGTYKQYNAVIDGEIGTVNVQNSTLQTTISSGNKLFGTAYYDEDELLTNATVMSGINANGTGLIDVTGYRAPVDGTIQLGYSAGTSYSYDDNTRVYTVNNQGKITEISILDLEDDTNDIVVASATKYVLDYVFITTVSGEAIPTPDPVEKEVTDTSVLGGNATNGYTFGATSPNGDAPKATVTLPTTVLNDLKGANSNSGAALTISTDNGDVKLPAYIFTDTLDSVDEAVNVVVEEVAAEDLGAAENEGNVVFGFSISLETESGDAVTVKDLEGNNRIVYTTTIPKGDDGQWPDDVEVYYVNGQTTTKETNVVYDNATGSLTVTLTHLSTFAVVEKETQTPGKTAAATADKTSVSVAEGDTATVTITKNDTNATLSVKSADTSKATVALDDTTLTITGVAAGSVDVTVTVTGDDDETYTYSDIIIKVTVTDEDTEGFTVSFNANGVSGYTAPNAQTVVSGGTATEPTGTGTTIVGTAGTDWKRLIGWTTDAAGDTAFNFTTKITADITLYAKWLSETSINAGTQGTLTVAGDGGNVTCTAPAATETGNEVVTYYNTSAKVDVSGIKNSSTKTSLEDNSNGLFKDDTKLASGGSITNPGSSTTIYVTFVEYDAQGYVVAVNQVSAVGTAATAQQQG